MGREPATPSLRTSLPLSALPASDAETPLTSLIFFGNSLRAVTTRAVTTTRAREFGVYWRRVM